MNYSILMPVYAGTNPQFLRMSIDSMLAQTVPSDDFVVVCDGPVGGDVERVLASYGGKLRVVRGRRHGGLGRALRGGLGFCRHDIIARMDDDDIAAPDRCEKQLCCLEADPEVGIVSGYVAEFFGDDPAVIKSMRRVPEKHEEICRFARHRNPFNHPAVMFRRQAVTEAGGYRPMDKHEDYYLWVRMLQNGVKGYNLQEPLVYMRASDEMYIRRGGRAHFETARRFEKYLFHSGFITLPEYLRNVGERFIVEMLVPGPVRAKLYRFLLRRISR